MKVGFKLDNLRIGFATNSSSSHSIILTKKDYEFTVDIDKNDYVFDLEDTDIMELEYNDIVSNSIKNKIIYFLMGFVYDNYYSEKSENKIIENILNLDGFRDLIKKEKIDLSILIPKIQDQIEDISLNVCSDFIDYTKKNDKKVFRAIINDFILNNNIGFLIDNETNIISYLREFILRGVNLQYKNGYLYYFNTLNGLKIRFERTDSLNKQKILIPDLIDLKITDRCNYNCEFCYQGSTIDGCESTLEEQIKTIKYLDKMNVFEIAVAGGDPTKQFEQLIKACKNENLKISLNTTTRNYKKGFEIINNNLDNPNFGAIGFSITSMKDLLEFSKFDFSCIPFNKKAIQFCPAFFKKEEIEEILNFAINHEIRLVFLGYKKIGRGLNYNPINSNYIKDVEYIIKNLNNNSWEGIVDFDQVMIDEISSEFKDKLSVFSFNFEEGKTSMYLDLVDKKLGLSSYEGNFLPFKLEDYEQFRKQLNHRYFLLKE